MKKARLSPQRSDIAYNLGIARGTLIDRIEPVPHFFVADWIRKKPPDNVFRYVGHCLRRRYITGYPVLLIFLFARGVRFHKQLSSCPLSFFLFAVMTTVFAWQSEKQATRKHCHCTGRSKPGESGSGYLKEKIEGTRVRVLEQIGAGRIELEDSPAGVDSSE